MALNETDQKNLGTRARRIYEETIRAQVEPQHVGEFVVVDLDSADFEIGPEMLEAFDRLKARRPRANPFVLRAGHRTAARLG